MTDEEFTEEYVHQGDEFHCESCMIDCLGPGECPNCGPLICVANTPAKYGQPDTAEKTLPLCVELRESPIHGRGIFAKVDLPKGLRFGPYAGERVKPEVHTSAYVWIISDKVGNPLEHIDGEDESKSNWLRWVNCSRSPEEEVMIPFQYENKVFFKTFRDIKKGQEIMYFYGTDYARNLGVDVDRPFWAFLKYTEELPEDGKIAKNKKRKADKSDLLKASRGFRQEVRRQIKGIEIDEEDPTTTAKELKQLKHDARILHKMERKMDRLVELCKGRKTAEKQIAEKQESEKEDSEEEEES